MANAVSDNKKARPNERLVFILDGLDFSFYDWEIEKAAKIYKEGYKKDPVGTLIKMAEEIRPDDPTKSAIDEMGCLVIHLGRKNLI